MFINNLIKQKCIYVKIKCLFTFYYYLKLSQKNRPEKKKGFYHENAKPKKLQNLYSKKKNSTVRYT